MVGCVFDCFTARFFNQMCVTKHKLSWSLLYWFCWLVGFYWFLRFNFSQDLLEMPGMLLQILELISC